MIRRLRARWATRRGGRIDWAALPVQLSPAINTGGMPHGYVPPSAALTPPPPTTQAQPSTSGPATELLTTAEHHAITLTAELWNLLASQVITNGPSRDSDTHELAAHIHAIQRAVLAQAAARSYPHRYRLLGGHTPNTTTHST